jgi:hypothetical protein
MKTYTRPEWQIVSRTGFRQDLSKEIKTVLSECHVRASVIWDRNGPCVAFETEADRKAFDDHFHH